MTRRTRTQTRRRGKEEGAGQTVFESLDKLSKEVAKEIGTGVMYRGNHIPPRTHVEFGVFMLDYALLGGIPEGLVSQVYGWEASGKTTLCMRAIANAQVKHPDKAVVFIDVEHTFDPSWAEHHGINTDDMFIVQPESGEQAIDILESVLRSDDTALTVLDSLPALVPQKEIDESVEDQHMALKARLIGRACSKILAATQSQRKKGNNPTTLFVNQFRSKIGHVMGDPRSLPGGNQPRYLATTAIEAKKKKEHVKQDENDIEIASHNEHGFSIKKSKVGNSIQSGEFILVRDPAHPLGQGAIDEGKQVVNYAKKLEIVTGGGSSWYLDGVSGKFGRLQEIADFLYGNEFEFALLKARIVAMRRRQMGLRPVPKDNYLMGVTSEQLGTRMDVSFTPKTRRQRRRRYVEGS